MKNKITEIQSTFEKIYFLTKNRDEEALTQVIKSGVSVDVFQGEHSLMLLLAKDKDYEGIELLINKFKVNRDAAVQSAARWGHVELVKKFIAEGASRDWAVWGAGDGGDDDLVDLLIKDGANPNSAVEGAAVGNHIELVCKLINKENASQTILNHAVRGAAARNLIELVYALVHAGASLDYAIWGAGAGNHVDLVNMLKEDGANSNYAVWGATAGGHIDLVNPLVTSGASRDYVLKGAEDRKYLVGKEDDILRFISLINDLDLRKLLISKAVEKNSSLDSHALLEKSTKLNTLIRENQLNYDQAQAWLLTELHIWFLQGIEKVEDDTFPPEIFMHIASFIGGISNQETVDLYNKSHAVMPKKLFDASINKTMSDFTERKNYFSLFNLFRPKKPEMTETEYLNKQKEAVNRYIKRISF